MTLTGQTDTTTTLRAWLAERGGQPTDPLFPTNRGGPLSHDALHQRPRRAHATATAACPSHPTCCGTPPRCGYSTPASTSPSSRSGSATNRPPPQIYLQADLNINQRALDRTTPPATAPGRYQPPDQILAFLAPSEPLRLCRHREIERCHRQRLPPRCRHNRWRECPRRRRLTAYLSGGTDTPRSGTFPACSGR
jgi:hypothetical protein